MTWPFKLKIKDPKEELQAALLAIVMAMDESSYDFYGKRIAPKRTD